MCSIIFWNWYQLIISKLSDHYSHARILVTENNSQATLEPKEAYQLSDGQIILSRQYP